MYPARVLLVFLVLLCFLGIIQAFTPAAIHNRWSTSRQCSGVKKPLVDNEISSCETTGSCRETRIAYKQQLEKQRQEKRAAGVDLQEDYTSKLSAGSKPPPGKKFSPFAKKIPTKREDGKGGVISF